MEDNLCQIILQCIRIHAQTVASEIQPFLDIDKESKDNGETNELAHIAVTGTIGAVGTAVGGVWGTPGAVIGTGIGAVAGEAIWTQVRDWGGDTNWPDPQGYKERVEQVPLLFAQMLVEKYGPGLEGLAGAAEADAFEFEMYRLAMDSGVFDVFLDMSYSGAIAQMQFLDEYYPDVPVNVPTIEDIRQHFLVRDPYSYRPPDILAFDNLEGYEAKLQQKMLFDTMNADVDMDVFQKRMLELTQTMLDEPLRQIEEAEQMAEESARLQEEFSKMIGNLDLRVTPMGIQVSNHEARIWELHDRLNTISAQLAHLVDGFTAPNRMADPTSPPPGVGALDFPG